MTLTGGEDAVLLRSVMRSVVPPVVRRYGRGVLERRALSQLEQSCISRERFIADIRAAVQAGAGYATAKIGASQKTWMYYPIFLTKGYPPDEVREYEGELRFHGLKQEGVFPDSPEFYLEFNRSYVDHVRDLDCLGICLRDTSQELEIINHYRLTNKLIHYPLQEPDRSTPSDESNCYLPLFSGKKILIVCPFGGLLKARATGEVFEAVWRKTGKKWFRPSSVDAIEFPYGFAPETQKTFPTILDLLALVRTQIDRTDFDVALIGAGGLAIPIASHIKRRGKIAIDLGGHLQVLFGVIGQRWRHWAHWQRDYFNEHWIDMPTDYRPTDTNVCDGGAYW